MPGLYQAWIERLAPPENAHDLMYGTWLEICRRTAELVDGVPLTLSDAPPEAAPPPAEYVPAMPFVMAGAAPRPRRVVFLGNCQLQSLATLHRLLVPDAETIHVQSYRSATDEGRAAVAGADALVRQVLDFAPAVGDLATTAETLLVPHTTLAFLWPYSGQPHPRNQPAPILDENGPYPGEFGDSFLNRLLLQEVPPDEAARRYLETDVAQVRRVDRLMELVLDKQRDRDRICGFGFADAIAGGFRTEPMFRSANQMERGFALAFAREVFGRMGLDGALLDRLDEVAPQHLSPPTEIPIHPSVAAHFGISYAPPNRRYAFFSEGRFEAPAFWERYMRYEWNPALAEALAALRVRDDARAIPLLIDALARAGRLDEAVVWAAEAVAAEPEIERHRTRLGQLERQRDAARNG